MPNYYVLMIPCAMLGTMDHGTTRQDSARLRSLEFDLSSLHGGGLEMPFAFSAVILGRPLP
jgi:hypothetical protein